jgi:hypothetical protein
LNAYRIEHAPDNMIPNTGKVFDPPPPNEDNGVLLEIVPDTRDIGRYLKTVC